MSDVRRTLVGVGGTGWSLSMKRIVLDVDTGFDDGVALLLAAASPQLGLCGATVCHDNAPLSVTLPNTRRVLHAGGFPDVPVLAGADRPPVRDPIVGEGIQTWRAGGVQHLIVAAFQGQ